MACPLFEPTERAPWARWQGRYRPPLGAPYAGRCHAHGAPAAAPEHALLDCCNMGYARGRCPQFNPAGPDATRFEIARQTTDELEIAWLAERNCLPAASGVAVFNRRTGSWRHEDELDLPLQRQLQAFADAMLDAGGES